MTATKTTAQKRAEVEVRGKASMKKTSSSTGDKASRTSKSKQKNPSRVEDYPVRALIEWKVGAHVSAAGGVENAIVNAASIGFVPRPLAVSISEVFVAIRANAFALFLKSQRKWTSPNLTERSIEAFKARLREFGYAPDLVLPHGSYLINLGNPDEFVEMLRDR